MKISMYDISVPPLILGLSNLKHILEKGAAYSREHDFDQEVVLLTRLYPNMLPLVKQVQIATDIAKFSVARLSGDDAPKHDDNEISFDELIARCGEVIAFIKSSPADKISGTEDKEIQLKLRSGELKFNGFAYLTKFVLPNVHFHTTTAYNILRSHGVPLGKQDFLGAIV